MTDRAAVIDTVQVLLVPEQDPLQPAKDEPLAAAAVSVTEVPEPKLAEQVEPQLIPAGLLETVPLPVPVLLTVSTLPAPDVAKVAVTVLAALIATTQVKEVPEQAPDQPVKVLPVPALA